MKNSQHYIDRTFTTTVIIKKIRTTTRGTLVQVVEGDCEHDEYILGHDAITVVKN